MKVDFVADVGNTAIKWGVAQGRPVEEVRFLPPDSRDWETVLLEWAGSRPESRAWAIAGSNPELRDEHVRWLTQHKQKVNVLTDYRRLPLVLNVAYPERVGLDRLLNAVAVNSRRPAKEPAVVIDLGSAVTVDLVDEAGVFQGGAIFPGFRMMSRALHEHTAALPEVQIEKAQRAPGKFTEEAIAAGVYSAVMGGIVHLVKQYDHCVGEPVPIYVGGGDGGLVSKTLAGELWPAMTLEGIRLSAEHA